MNCAPGPGGLVVVVLTWRGRIGLFKAGARLGPGAGRWCCPHEALGVDEDAVAGAVPLLLDATGLGMGELEALQPGPVLWRSDEAGHGRPIHTVLARTNRRRLCLGEAHTAHRWVRRDQLARFDGQVAWLGAVIDAVLEGEPATAGVRDLQPAAI